MKLALVSAALVAVLAAPAFAQQPPASTMAPPVAEGSVRVEGVAAEKVLGAIDTKALVDGEATAQPAVQPETTATAQATVRASVDAEAPQAKTEVTVDTEVVETATATIETKTETIAPVQTAQLDAQNPIAVEVQAVVSGKPRYTTKDIAQAQLDAVLAAPASIPTTTITTKTTTLKPGQ